MPPPSTRPWLPVVAGVAVAVLYLVTALTCMFATSSPDDFMTATAEHRRNVGLVPYAVVALSLLLVGLVARRWWQAPVAPVVVAAGGFWWLTWLMNIPQHMAENNWSPEHVSEVVDFRGTTWHVVAVLVVVGGWGLVRRNGWWWALGLLPSAALVGATEAVARAFQPDSTSSVADRMEFLRSFSHDYRVSQTVAIGLTVLAVVGGAWLCVAAETLAARATSSRDVGPANQAPPPYGAPRYAPPVAPLSVADELRKLADLRDAGELTAAEFETEKTRLLAR